MAAIGNWAESSTRPTSERRLDIKRDKKRVVNDFFDCTGKPINQIDPTDVRAWQKVLEARGLAHCTVYASISKVSSFYKWAMESPEFRKIVKENPVILARPKAPIPYQGEKTKALTEDQISKLLQVMK